MLKSMTGYGRWEAETANKRITIEIKSVNHRFLDTVIRMSKQFISLEDKMRKTIQEKIFRGHVDVFVSIESISEDRNIKVDKELAKAYYNEIKELQEIIGISEPIGINELINLPEVLKLEASQEDMDALWLTIRSVIVNAVDSLVEMRIAEGAKLAEDIKRNLDKVAVMNNLIEERAPLVVMEYKDKLKNKLDEWLLNGIIDENRLAAEVAIMAERADINEEVVRLNSHIKQFNSLLDGSEPVGRKLDFLVQEMYREVNTIGSKANDVEIAAAVVNMKSEIEKIKEQVQNIE